MLTSLIISRDQQLVWSVEPALRQLQFEVEVKRSVAESMDALRLTRYNTVVIDARCGRLQELRQARDFPLNRESIMIAVAGGCRITPKELAQAGADAVWIRPLLQDQVFQTLVAARGVATGDRRLNRRHKLDHAAFLRYSYNGRQFFESIILDISATGVAIESLEKVTVGRAVQVQFALPAMLSNIQALAEVLWHDGNGRAGLRFLEMSEDHHRQLERWLENFGLGMSAHCSFAVLSSADAGLRYRM